MTTFSATTTPVEGVTYVVSSTITLTTNKEFKNNILVFQGGKLKAADNISIFIKFTNCKIWGVGYLFDNVNITNNSTLINSELRAEWFGVAPNQSGIITKNNLNRAIIACYNTNVHKLVFGSGCFNIEGIVEIGIGTTTRDNSYQNYWDIELIGAGTIPARGTSFQFVGANSKFVIDQRNDSMGNRRGGGIYDCCFYQTVSYDDPDIFNNTGIEIEYAHTYTIYKCAFNKLETGIRLKGRSYYVDIQSCTFDLCAKGIESCSGYSPENSSYQVEYGYPNNNIVEKCMFTGCELNPIDLSLGGVAWHIMDCDFEGANGTINLGDSHRLTNVRIERNLSTASWLRIGNNCVIDAEFHQTDIEDFNPNWKFVIDGNNNIVHARITGYNPYAIVSYGQGNKFDVISDNGNSTTPMQFVFHPDDEFILNGYSNKQDYIGTNLIHSLNNIEFSAEDEMYIYDNLYDSIYSNMYNPNDYREINKQTLRAVKKDGNSNPTLGLVTIVSGDLYKTCTFWMSRTGKMEETINVPLFGNFNMDSAKLNHSYCYIGAYVGTKNSTSNIEFCAPNANDKLYVCDVVVSKIPLYKRPVLETIEENTLSQIGNDGIIHLRKSYLNRVITTFSWIPNRLQYYTNMLGKVFCYSVSQQKYYCEGKEVLSSQRVNGIIKTTLTSVLLIIYYGNC